MSLLGLPSEILMQIVRESIPDDFESLLLSCRALFECGKQYVKQHNKHKRDYRLLSINGQSDASWLAYFAQEPIIPFYTRTVDLRWHGDNLRPRQCEDIKRQITALIEQSLYCTVDSVDPSFWINMILSDLNDPDNYREHYRFLGVLYLTFFPNVTNLTLPWTEPGGIPYADYVRSYNQFERVLYAIALQSRSKYNQKSLGKLRRLNYLLQADYNIHERLQLLLPLLTLPNLEELYANSLTAVDYLQDFKWTHPEPHSNLRIIDFTHCCMDAVGISELLAHTPYLTTFRYRHASKHHGMESYWDAGQFVAAVEKQVGSQLRHLTVTVEVDSINAIYAGVTSMHGFTMLETLEMDLATFYGPSVESGEKAGILNTPPKPGYDKWTVEAIPALYSILPTNLQSFTMIAHSWQGMSLDSKAMMLLFDKLRSMRISRIPNLSRCLVVFVLQHQGQAISRFEEICEMLESEDVGYSVLLNKHRLQRREWEVMMRGSAMLMG